MFWSRGICSSTAPRAAWRSRRLRLAAPAKQRGRSDWHVYNNLEQYLKKGHLESRVGRNTLSTDE